MPGMSSNACRGSAVTQRSLRLQDWGRCSDCYSRTCQGVLEERHGPQGAGQLPLAGDLQEAQHHSRLSSSSLCSRRLVLLGVPRVLPAHRCCSASASRQSQVAQCWPSAGSLAGTTLACMWLEGGGGWLEAAQFWQRRLKQHKAC